MSSHSICSIPDCNEQVLARGWCRKHYSRWWYHGDPLRERPTVEERFASCIDPNGPIPEHAPELGPCTLWTGDNNRRYGRVHLTPTKSLGAHVYAWQRVNGEVPKGLCVCHKCDNKLCVRVDHLFLGTPQDNQADKVRKGRQARGNRHGSQTHPERLARGDRNGSRTKPERLKRGEDNGSSKLTEEAVRQIRIRLAKGESKQSIAKDFNVSPIQIYRIGRNQTWRHVK